MYPSTFVYDYHLADDKFLLINTLSFALDVVPRRIRDLVCAARGPIDVGDTDPELVDSLVRRDYLWTGPDDEDKRLRRLERPVAGTGFTLAPTHSCNASCPYCFQRRSGIRQLDMTAEVLDSAFRYITEQLATVESSEPPEITLYGGEPLQRRLSGLLGRTLEFARSNGMTVSLFTNGIEFDGFRELLDRYRTILGSLQITIDGPEEVHRLRRFGTSRGGDPDEFRSACAAVEWFLDRDLSVSARINVDRHNLGTVRELADWVKTVGWFKHPKFTLRCTPVTATQNPDNPDVVPPEEMETILYEQFAGDPALLSAVTFSPHRFMKPIIQCLDRFLSGTPGQQPDTRFHPRVYFCQAASVSRRMLGADGMIYCCFEAIGRQELAVGSYHPTVDFPETRWRPRSAASITVCRRCRIMPLCGGGCPMASVEGDIQPDAALGLCEGRQTLLRRYLDSLRPRLVSGLNSRTLAT